MKIKTIYTHFSYTQIIYSAKIAPIERDACILPQCDHKYKHPSVGAPNRSNQNQSIFLQQPQHRHHLPVCNIDASHDTHPCTAEEDHRWASHLSLSSLRTPIVCVLDKNCIYVLIDRRSVVRAMVAVWLVSQLYRRMVFEWLSVLLVRSKCVGRGRRGAADSVV